MAKTLEEKLAECRARSAKRHTAIRSRASKRYWRSLTKAQKWEIIKRLYAVSPLVKRKQSS